MESTRARIGDFVVPFRKEDPEFFLVTNNSTLTPDEIRCQSIPDGDSGDV